MPLANRVMATLVDVVPPVETATETASRDRSPSVNSHTNFDWMKDLGRSRQHPAWAFFTSARRGKL